ncbi:hypothetical protein [uncultured Winogradskyella sp.]|uniref:hypothetical protein n=1 Tax=Winogradskyella sp. 4-2091 TaxID=3381659 RepID=UPI00261CD744|nr:hypothetical protein [uncultured Winogradskyella sp.]
MLKKINVILLICLFISAFGYSQIKTKSAEPLIFEDTLEIIENLDYSESDFNKMTSYFKQNKELLEIVKNKSSNGNNHLKDFLSIINNSYPEAIDAYGNDAINMLIYSYYQSVERQEKFNKLNLQLQREIDSLENLKTFYTSSMDSLAIYPKTSASVIVKDFISAYNKKDSIATFQLLHKDFAEYFNKDKTISSKTNYASNYAWGNVMNDKMNYIIVLVDDSEIEVLSTYHCDRDRLLNVTPYKSIRRFEIKDSKIYRIYESEIPDFETEYQERQQSYQLFFKWASEHHNLNIMDFKFNHSAAKKLKQTIIEYDKKN